MRRILAINPGSKSTEIALYDEKEKIWSHNINYLPDELKTYPKIFDQLEMRLKSIQDVIHSAGFKLSSLSAVVGNGGLLPHAQSGAYLITPKMIEVLREQPVKEDASNLGCALAYKIARAYGISAYIYDPVTIDEMVDITRVTGRKNMQRIGQGHNLNMRAAAIRYAEQYKLPYKKMNLIVAHLGSGITLSLHEQGRITDMISDDEGPFSPERAGGLPGFRLIREATSGQYDYLDMMRRVQYEGGLLDHLGTTDVRIVEERISKGDSYANLIYQAMALNVSKNIAKLSVDINGKVDAIILTGDIANSILFVNWIIERVRFIAEVVVMPGENALESLAFGALRVLNGEEHAHLYFD